MSSTKGVALPRYLLVEIFFNKYNTRHHMLDNKENIHENKHGLGISPTKMV